jgi:hypothetical protein
MLQRSLLGWSAVVLLGAAAALGPGTRHDERATAAASNPTTSSAPDPGPRSHRSSSTATTTTTAGSMAVGADPPATGPPGHPTAPVPAASTSEPIVPGPVHLAAPGTYAVRQRGPDGEHVDGSLVVDARGASRRGQVLRLGDGEEQRLVELSSGGLVEIATGDCGWAPALPVVPEDIHVGSSWSTTSTCTVRTSEGSIVVEQQEDARITGKARTTVGGQDVDTWLIERHVVSTRRADGATAVIEIVSSELFAPSLGLTAYAVSRTDAPRPDGTIATFLSSVELLTATPA